VPAVRRVGAAAGALLASSAMLGGCAVLEVKEPVRTPSAIEACAMGHRWSLDVSALANVVAEILAERGVGGIAGVAAEGAQTLDWTMDGTFTLDSDYTIVVTLATDPATEVRQTVSGVSGGQVFFSGAVAVPRDWSEAELEIETTATQGETPLDPPPVEIPKTVIDDMVGLETICDGGQLIMEGRGTNRTWTFTAVG